ncbi:MAG: hypothetical protein OXI39_05890 [Gemmatimonadota bacterium]|uniref:hypothetical protein n=1 Tax=Candidatus Palauibacter scopulicola TaxID=3056741 RepID=UPI00239F1579|nr:hypothetical protein [Candidatus Palauibacter scopulicola]MDE2662519.1 hypothetical protein [Candidatus Palauibacter scopulicola]
MLPSTRRALPILLALVSAATAPSQLAGQFSDARLPRQGKLWLTIAPTLLNWSEQFAFDSSAAIVDGEREPLAAHFDGPLARRMFPPPFALIQELNDDAEALGFEPVTEDDFSFGGLDFSAMRAQVRRLALGVEVGVLDWVSVGARAPFTLTDMTVGFAFDSTATVTGNVAAFESGAPFVLDARSALDDLGELIDGGSLTGTALDEAVALRSATLDFVNALRRRASAGALIPTASSVAGTQMAQRFADFAAAFDALGLTLPELSLPEFATEEDYDTLFLSQGFADRLPRDTRNELDLGEVEVFLRVNLIDGITRRRPIPGPAADAAAGSDPGTDPERGIRLRTSVGALARLPIRNRNLTIFGDPSNSADIPIGDGQTDIELALYQDIAFGSLFMIRASARYGMQRPDEAVIRFTPPDRPYNQADLVALMRRDLGDYLAVLVRPSLRFNAALSVGLEYDYFRLPAPTYQFVGMIEGLDPNTVAAEGAQTRHRLGVGFLIDISEAGGVEELHEGARPVRGAYQFGISLRRAISGSGGRTPASFRYAAELRFPITIF